VNESAKGYKDIKSITHEEEQFTFLTLVMKTALLKAMNRPSFSINRFNVGRGQYSIRFDFVVNSSSSKWLQDWLKHVESEGTQFVAESLFLNKMVREEKPKEEIR
jgi:hypothetical protein